jgi:cysteine desulfurase / selenocysteine lyase
MSFTSAEIQQIRTETDATKHLIHFNNAGAALMPNAIRDAMIGYIQYETMHGSYETAAKFQVQLEHTYDAIAELIHADKEEIAILENSTAAWHMAFHSLNFRKGDVILTCEAEYASNYISFLQAKKRRGIEIRIVPNDEYGQIDVEALATMITSEVKLIAITYIPTNGGLINPAVEIGKVARKNKIPYLLDACQAVGQIPVNVREIGCDFLSATGRKYLRGPRGIGFLYIRKAWLDAGIEPIFLDLHAAEWISEDKYKMRPDARRFENWENNLAAKYAFGLAIDYALSIGIERLSDRLCALAAQLREKLSAMEGVTVHDIGEKKGGIVSFSIAGKERDAIIQHLAEHQINVSPISKNGTFIEMSHRNLGDDLVRASVHYYNTEKEIERFCEVIKAFL